MIKQGDHEREWGKGVNKMIDTTKFLGEIQERPEIWRNMCQTLQELVDDEVQDPDPATFVVILAAAFAEHTDEYDDAGNKTFHVDVYDADGEPAER